MDAPARTGHHCCAVALCTNSAYKEDGTIYHLFPRNEKVRRIWVSRCKRTDKFNVSSSRVCSKHFRPEDYKRDLMNELLGLPIRRVLFPNAVPSLRIPNWHGETIVGTSDGTVQVTNGRQVRRDARDVRKRAMSRINSLSLTDLESNENKTDKERKGEQNKTDKEGISEKTKVRTDINTKNEVILEKNMTDMEVNVEKRLVEEIEMEEMEETDQEKMAEYKKTEIHKDVHIAREKEVIMEKKKTDIGVNTEQCMVDKGVETEENSNMQSIENNQPLTDDKDVEIAMLYKEIEKLKRENSFNLLVMKHTQAALRSARKRFLVTRRKSSLALKVNYRIKLQQDVKNILSKFFSSGQIHYLLQDKKTVKWSAKDIENSLVLWAISRDAYKYLRKCNYPLPSCSTLERWTRHIKVQPWHSSGNSFLMTI